MTFYWNDCSKERLPRAVFVLAAGIFLLGTSEFVVAGLLPLVATDLRVTVPRAGLLISAFAVGMVVGAPAMSALTLRLPPRTTLAAALGVFAAGHAVVALSSSFALILGARMVTAVATGAFWAVAAVVVTAAAGPASSTRALGVLVSGLTVANVAGVPLGALAGRSLGWRAPFWGLALLSLAALVAVVALVPAPPRTAARPRLAPQLVAFSSGRLWLVLLTAALAQAAVFAAFSYVSPLLTGSAGLSASTVPVVLAGFGVGALGGSLAGGRLGGTHPRATVALALAGTAAVLTALHALSSSPTAAVPLVILLGLTGFTVAAPLTARVLQLATAAPMLASAAATSAFNVGNTVGPWVGGRVLAAGTGPAAPAGAGAVLALGALVVWGALTRAGQDATGTPDATPAHVSGRHHVHRATAPPP